MNRIAVVAGIAVCAVAVILVVRSIPPGQRADNSWDPSVVQPAYTESHPRVTIDQAHSNVHTAGGKYRPFARLVIADGYEVQKGKELFTAESLAETEILVIVNAAGGWRPQIFGINIPVPMRKKREMPAFTSDEIEAVRTWVERGGSLLLIADHAPFGKAARALAETFGVRMNGGFVEVPNEQSDPLLFMTENGRLGDHPTISGDSSGTHVQRVMTFTGQSLDGPPEASVLLKLPESAVEYVPTGVKLSTGLELREQPAGGAQGLALECGFGRVVVLGEAAMLTAQVYKKEKFGMNTPGNDNRQFALNIMHWLSRLPSP